jgi:eukaryotic-like serine/threonine-protein kinase
MGVVYEAFDEERRAAVALKTIRSPSPDALARFKREFRVMQDVHHTNIVTLGELCADGDECFFTMELVEGSDFLSYVRRAHRGPVDGTAQPSGSGVAFASTKKMAVAPVAVVDGRGAVRGFDEARLRDALAQLVRALAALHSAGIVHRDVKPSNIRVTHEGRLVLLDFGLASDLTKEGSTALKMAGTPAYMAPEQALSGAVGPEADWYGVGVLLYEALAGVVPFDGAALEVLMKKQSQTADPPRSLVPDIPADLDALCVALIHFDPKARPTVALIERALGATETPGTSASRPSVADPAPFVGRATELDALRSAFEDSRQGVAVSVLVEGESGVGKSCLVRHFVKTLGADHQDLVVLAGRCYEREAVPYKALDGVVDALAHVLVRNGDALATRILPLRPEPLAHVFPVLRRVRAFANATRGPAPVADPVDLRNRAFAAMRDMLARLGAVRPCVVVIDDLQWADADSLALLGEIMRRPEEPQLLLIATMRSTPHGTSPDASAPPRQSAELVPFGDALGGDARTLTLARMPEEDARALATRLLEREAPGGAERFAEGIAREAAGHPLFIDALVRYSAVAGEATGGLRLEDALWARVSNLAAGPKQVMEMLAVAGAPITQDVLASAVGGDRAELGGHISLLRVAHLVSITGARTSDTIEPYHDRVRAAVLANIADDERVTSHRALALALEQAPRRETEALARHWRGAGDTTQAAAYSAQAADEAAGALAFDRAVSLYKTAIDLGPRDGAERSALLERLGDALANGGHSVRAAGAYTEASRGAHAARSLDLQRRGADQLLGAGHFDEGLVVIGRVLASIGLKLPRSPLSGLLILLVYRVYLRVRGLGFRARDVSQITATELTRIDVCSSLAHGLGVADTVRGAAFQARTLVLALRSGERYRIARALASEAAYASASGGSAIRRTEALLARAHTLAAESGNPYAIGLAHCSSGIAYHCFGQWKRAIEHLERAKAVWAEAPGTPGEQNTMLFVATNCLVYLGQIGRVARETPEALREARQRGHLFAAVNLSTGSSSVAWLALDEPEAALANIDEAMSRWSKRGFHIEHLGELEARTNAFIYSGRPREAHTLIAARWPALRRSLLPLTIQPLRIHAVHARARSALATAEEGGADRATLLREAATAARRMERERMDHATWKAKLLRAGIAVTRRESTESAVSLLHEAIAGFDAADMALYAAATRRCLGALLGGDEGRQLLLGADAWMTSEMIKNPARMTAMLAPGFGRLG